MNGDIADHRADASEAMIDHEKEAEAENNIKDRYFMTYILFYSLGTMTMVPVHFFITANDYWMYKFRDPNVPWVQNSSANKSDLQAEFTSYFSITSNVTSLVMLVVTIIFARRICLHYRMIGSLTTILLLFGVTMIFVTVNTDTWQRGFFGLTMFFCILLNCGSSVFTVTLFELIGKFPPGYMAAVLSGQSICGIFAALVQIASLGIGASSTVNAFFYFSVGTLCVFTTITTYLATSRMSNFYMYYFSRKGDNSKKAKPSFELVKKVFHKIKYYLICMLVVLGSSVAIHPGVTSLIESTEKGNGREWNDVYFKPVVTFLFYNVFDFAGREIAGVIKKPSNSTFILTVGVIRLIMLPMLMLCNANPREHLPVAINSDAAYIIFILIFAFTNGYIVNLCIIKIPGTTEEEEKGVSVILIVVSMIVILGLCSLLSVLLINLL